VTLLQKAKPTPWRIRQLRREKDEQMLLVSRQVCVLLIMAARKPGKTIVPALFLLCGCIFTIKS
jgi:hypothetical protein